MTEEKKYSSRREFLNNALVRGKKYGGPVLRESVSTAVLAGGLAYLLKDVKFLEDFREALYNARHAGRTGYEMISGGPAGMKAARNLEEAIAIVEESAKNNENAGEALENYLSKRKELVLELGNIYKENETLSRESERLWTQLQGALKSFFEIGNSLKPDFWKRLDNSVIKLYGQDPIEAREKSGRLKEFYQSVRRFYDSREKNEHTVKEFCDYLVRVKEESTEQNRKFNELFPNVIGRVKEGYEKEDELFVTGEKGVFGVRKDIKESDLEKTEESVEGYKRKVDATENEVRVEMPIEPFKERNFVDYVTNPVTLGLIGTIFLKGLSNISTPTRKGLTYLTLAPYYVTKGAVKGAGRLIKRYKKSDNSNVDSRK